MSDFRPSSVPGTSIGPPVPSMMKPQFQMPQPGGQPLQQQMAGFTQPMPRPSPGISPALNQSGQFPQFRPGITPPFQPGMVPRSGMSHSPQPFPTASAFQPPSAVNGVRPNPNLTPGPGMFPPARPPPMASSTPTLFPPGPPMPSSANPVTSPISGPTSSFPPPVVSLPGGLPRPTGLPSPIGPPSSVTGPLRPPPMGQNSATATPLSSAPPSSGPSPQFGAPPINGQNAAQMQLGGTPISLSGPNQRFGAPPISSAAPMGSAPPLNSFPPSSTAPPTSNITAPSSLTPASMAPPLSSGPPTSNVGPRYAPPSSSGQLMAGTSGPQFGAPLVNGPSGSMPPPPTSQYGGQPPLNGGHLSGPQSFSALRPGMPPPPPSMQQQQQPGGMLPPPPTAAQHKAAMQQAPFGHQTQQQPYGQQHQGALPPPPMSNGPSAYLPPPSLSSTGDTSMQMAGPRMPGMPPLRPTGMPPMPNQQQPVQQQPMNGLNARLGNLSFNQGMEPVDLLQNRHILPAKAPPAPKPRLQADAWNSANCSPEIFRCTLTKIPETDNLLKKARLPLGILIHPFKDLSHLPVIQCSTIVRCRQCRTYINPFVTFVDQRRWRCNICYRVNELPEEFLYDPVSKSYGDPSRRPECKSSTIEFIAPSEYMLRPPQPAVYVFCLDTSRQALETGYLKVFCEVLLDELDKLPGDARTQVAFITYDRSVHFYSMPEGSSQPTQLTVSDIDDIFLPSPSDLLVNLHENRNLIMQLLEELPNLFSESHATESALGAALQAAFKISSPTGGRITVFQNILPKIGPGALPNREISTERSSSSDSSLLGPATDFYKKMSLDCSGQQVAVDLFAMGSQFQDLATLSGMSKFSAGQIQHFPGYHTTLNPAMAAKFENALRRYLTRKIGFEAVMRVRCTRGLALHAFHGNFFVRSTDLLSLPNINPDAGFGIQVAIEEDLRDSREVSFQAALLYTSSKGERRIRVHTLCLPTTANINDVINGADEAAVVGMLTKFASDRSVTDSLADAKEGLVVSCVDAIETYKTQTGVSVPNGLLISQSLKLLPLHVLACLRSTGFRPGIKLDERSSSFALFKTLPLQQLIQMVYPDLYRVDNMTEEGGLRQEGDDSSDEDGNTEIIVPQPERLQLSFERISATGMYLLDLGDIFYLYLSRGLHAFVLEKCFGVTRLHDVNEGLTELPELQNSESEKLRTFVQWLNGQKPFSAPIKIIREDGKSRHLFVEKMIEDRMDNSFSYFEFLQHIKQQIK